MNSSQNKDAGNWNRERLYTGTTILHRVANKSAGIIDADEVQNQRYEESKKSHPCADIIEVE